MPLHWRAWQEDVACVVALACVAGVLGCSSPDVAPSRPPAERESGTYIARALAEQAPKPLPPATPPKKAPSFHSPFGQAIATLPNQHLETSVGGRDLNYWVVGEGRETMLVIGGIHGDERSSAEAAYDLIAHVLQQPQLVGDRRLVVAPEVNPDGIHANTRRNLRNVDLNRNFPAENWVGVGDGARHGPGPRAASEPETRFVMMLLERFTPDRIVATHAAAACVNWDGPAERLARTMSRECGLPAKGSIGYPTPGSLGSYMGIDQEIPTITFELAARDSIEGARDSIRAALLAALHYPNDRNVKSAQVDGPARVGSGSATESSPRR